MVGQGSNDVQETLSLIGKVCDAAECHLLYSVQTPESFSSNEDLHLACLQRLINCTVPIVMEIDPSSNLMFRLCQLWTTIRNSSFHLVVERECIEFLVGGSMFPTEAFDANVAAKYLQKVNFLLLSTQVFCNINNLGHN